MESTRENLLQTQRSIIQALEASDLESVRQSTSSLIDRWGAFLGIILPAQLGAIGGKTQDELTAFNDAWSLAAATDTELKELNEKKWRMVFKRAFGIRDIAFLSLEKAREIILAISAAMQSPEFLDEVSRLTQPEETMLEKRQALLTLLLPLHMRVLEPFGFNGESGWLQAQRALMDHWSDKVVSEESAKAQKIVFEKSGLLGKGSKDS